MTRWPRSTYSLMLILLMGAMALVAPNAGADVTTFDAEDVPLPGLFLALFSG